MDQPLPKPLSERARRKGLPDFIIVGAMKCGTSSLHHILAHHPDVFVPDGEIGFFDIDDLQQHPDFLLPADHCWHFPDFEKNLELYLDWYRSLFAEARENQMIGEDSTTYIASAKAARRIAAILPDVKILVMLRDPAARSYSNYWHLVQTGRAIYDFERTLRFGSETVWQRSLYRSQVLNFLRHFPRSNVHFILFEEFVANMSEVVRDVCEFLGLDSVIDLSSIDTHRNRTSVPRRLRLRLLCNRLLRERLARRYASDLPGMPAMAGPGLDIATLAIQRVARAIAPLSLKRPPPIRPATHRFLNEFFARENEGLSDLIGKRVEDFWYRNPSGA